MRKFVVVVILALLVFGLAGCTSTYISDEGYEIIALEEQIEDYEGCVVMAENSVAEAISVLEYPYDYNDPLSEAIGLLEGAGLPCSISEGY